MYAFLLGIGFERLPLAEKQELDKTVELDFIPQQLPVAADRFGLVLADSFLRPGVPAFHPEVCLDRGIEGVVIQPALVFFAEGLKLLFQRLQAPLEGLSKERIAPLIELAVIRPGRLLSPVERIHFFLCQKPLFDQQIQIDQIRVSGKAGIGGIGAVAEPGGSERQQLPVFLSRCCEKINKTEGFPSHGSDPVGRRQ